MEDAFDGSTRRNLRHLIVTRDEEPELQIGLDAEKKGDDSTVDASSVNASIEDDGASISQRSVQYYVMDESDSLGDVKANTANPHPKPLARIPTCAIFHKLTTGRGVPHAFSSECLAGSL